jgi:MSHA biogenesis protein MshI
LALELQRTFDYYESHLRQSPISQLIIICNEKPLKNLADMLQQRLGIDCIDINIPNILTLNKSIVNVDHKCITAIGGALRDF